MAEVIVRRGRITDDLRKIAACLYLTDPFIYPAAFGTDADRAACAMAKLMTVENGLLHPEHIALALQGEEICGILLYNKDGAVWNVRECGEKILGSVPDPERFRIVSEAYFVQEAEAPPENHVEVVACCVMPGFRKMGIGERLIRWLREEYRDCKLTLTVLADNQAAIRLYGKCGFSVTEQLKGFSLEESSRPDCCRMECPSAEGR